MGDNSRTAKKLRDKIGMSLEPVIFEVEKGAIRRFAEAVEDTNPLYTDDECAGNTRYAGIVSPPGFFGQPVRHNVGMETLLGMEVVLNLGVCPSNS